MDNQHSTQTTKPARRKTKASSNLKARSRVAPAKSAPAIVGQSSEQTGRGSLSAKDSAGSGPAATVATNRMKQSGGCYDWMPVTVGIPEVRSVIVWDYALELPHAAYFDPDENCWNSLHDGARIDGVTDWMYYLTPEGGESGRARPTSTTTGAARGAEIKRLAALANTITAILSTSHILDPDQQQEAILDCSSLADDFARDLDALAGAPL